MDAAARRASAAVVAADDHPPSPPPPPTPYNPETPLPDSPRPPSPDPRPRTRASVAARNAATVTTSVPRTATVSVGRPVTRHTARSRSSTPPVRAPATSAKSTPPGKQVRVAPPPTPLPDEELPIADDDDRQREQRNDRPHAPQPAPENHQTVDNTDNPTEKPQPQEQKKDTAHPAPPSPPSTRLRDVKPTPTTVPSPPRTRTAKQTDPPSTQVLPPRTRARASAIAHPHMMTGPAAQRKSRSAVPQSRVQTVPTSPKPDESNREDGAKNMVDPGERETDQKPDLRQSGKDVEMTDGGESPRKQAAQEDGPSDEPSREDGSSGAAEEGERAQDKDDGNGPDSDVMAVDKNPEQGEDGAPSIEKPDDEGEESSPPKAGPDVTTALHDDGDVNMNDDERGAAEEQTPRQRGDDASEDVKPKLAGDNADDAGRSGERLDDDAAQDADDAGPKFSALEDNAQSEALPKPAEDDEVAPVENPRERSGAASFSLFNFSLKPVVEVRKPSKIVDVMDEEHDADGNEEDDSDQNDDRAKDPDAEPEPDQEQDDEDDEREPESRLEPEAPPSPDSAPRHSYSTRRRTRSQAHSPLRTRRRHSEPAPRPAPKPMAKKRPKYPKKGDQLRVLWHVDNIYYQGVVDSVLTYKGKRFYDITYDSAEREYYVDLTVRKWRFVDERDRGVGDDLEGRMERDEEEEEEEEEEMDEDRFPKRGDKVMIMWHVDGKYYAGVIKDVLRVGKRLFHDVSYDKGDLEFFLDLKVRKWRYQNPDGEEDEVEEILPAPAKAKSKGKGKRKGKGKTAVGTRRSSRQRSESDGVLSVDSPSPVGRSRRDEESALVDVDTIQKEKQKSRQSLPARFAGPFDVRESSFSPPLSPLGPLSPSSPPSPHSPVAPEITHSPSPGRDAGPGSSTGRLPDPGDFENDILDLIVDDVDTPLPDIFEPRKRPRGHDIDAITADLVERKKQKAAVAPVVDVEARDRESEKPTSTAAGVASTEDFGARGDATARRPSAVSTMDRENPDTSGPGKTPVDDIQVGRYRPSFSPPERQLAVREPRVRQEHTRELLASQPDNRQSAARQTDNRELAVRQSSSDAAHMRQRDSRELGARQPVPRQLAVRRPEHRELVRSGGTSELLGRQSESHKFATRQPGSRELASRPQVFREVGVRPSATRSHIPSRLSEPVSRPRNIPVTGQSRTADVLEYYGEDRRRPKTRVSDIVSVASLVAKKWANAEVAALTRSIHQARRQVSTIKKVQGATDKVLRKRAKQLEREEQQEEEADRGDQTAKPTTATENYDLDDHLVHLKTDIVDQVKRYRRTVEERERNLKRQFAVIKSQAIAQNAKLMESAKAVRSLGHHAIPELNQLEPKLKTDVSPFPGSSPADLLSSPSGLMRTFPSIGYLEDEAARSLQQRVSDLSSRSEILAEEVKRLQIREKQLISEKEEAIAKITKSKPGNDVPAVPRENSVALDETAAVSVAQKDSRTRTVPAKATKPVAPSKPVGIVKKKSVTSKAAGRDGVRHSGKANRKTLPRTPSKYRPPPPMPKIPPAPQPVKRPVAPKKKTGVQPAVQLLPAPVKHPAQFGKHVDKQSADLLALIATVWLLQDEGRSEPPKKPGEKQDQWVEGCVKGALRHAVSYLATCTGIASARKTLLQEVDGETMNTGWISAETDPGIEEARANYKLWEPTLAQEEWLVEKRVLCGLNLSIRTAMKFTAAEKFSGTIMYAKEIARRALVDFDTVVGTGLQTKSGPGLPGAPVQPAPPSAALDVSLNQVNSLTYAPGQIATPGAARMPYPAGRRPAAGIAPKPGLVNAQAAVVPGTQPQSTVAAAKPVSMLPAPTLPIGGQPGGPSIPPISKSVQTPKGAGHLEKFKTPTKLSPPDGKDGSAKPAQPVKTPGGGAPLGEVDPSPTTVGGKVASGALSVKEPAPGRIEKSGIESTVPKKAQEQQTQAYVATGGAGADQTSKPSMEPPKAASPSSKDRVEGATPSHSHSIGTGRPSEAQGGGHSDLEANKPKRTASGTPPKPPAVAAMDSSIPVGSAGSDAQGSSPAPASAPSSASAKQLKPPVESKAKPTAAAETLTSGGKKKADDGSDGVQSGTQPHAVPLAKPGGVAGGTKPGSKATSGSKNQTAKAKGTNKHASSAKNQPGIQSAAQNQQSKAGETQGSNSRVNRVYRTKGKLSAIAGQVVTTADSEVTPPGTAQMRLPAVPFRKVAPSMRQDVLVGPAETTEGIEGERGLGPEIGNSTHSPEPMDTSPPKLRDIAVPRVGGKMLAGMAEKVPAGMAGKMPMGVAGKLPMGVAGKMPMGMATSVAGNLLTGIGMAGVAGKMPSLRPPKQGIGHKGTIGSGERSAAFLRSAPSPPAKTRKGNQSMLFQAAAKKKQVGFKSIPQPQKRRSGMNNPSSPFDGRVSVSTGYEPISSTQQMHQQSNHFSAPLGSSGLHEGFRDRSADATTQAMFGSGESGYGANVSGMNERNADLSQIDLMNPPTPSSFPPLDGYMMNDSSMGLKRLPHEERESLPATPSDFVNDRGFTAALNSPINFERNYVTPEPFAGNRNAPGGTGGQVSGGLGHLMNPQQQQQQQGGRMDVYGSSGRIQQSFQPRGPFQRGPS